MAAVVIIHRLPVCEGFSCEEENRERAFLTCGSLRQLVQKHGLQPFEDGWYRGWIHPFSFYYLLCQSESNVVEDVYLDARDLCHQTVRTGDITFTQTVVSPLTVVFGAGDQGKSLLSTYEVLRRKTGYERIFRAAAKTSRPEVGL